MDFKNAIVSLLQQRAETDEQFAKVFVKPNKSVDECARYILQEVCKMNEKHEKCIALSDAEVINMAIHYFDEDSIKVEEEPKNVQPMSIQEEWNSKFVNQSHKAPIVPMKPKKPKWEEGDLFFGMDEEEEETDKPEESTEESTTDVEPDNTEGDETKE